MIETRTRNLEIREACKNSGVFHWQVAERLGIAEGVFSKSLRRELPQKQKQRVLEAIKAIAEEREREATEDDEA